MGDSEVLAAETSASPSPNHAALSLCLGQMSAADSVARDGPRLLAQTTASNVSMTILARAGLVVQP